MLENCDNYEPSNRTKYSYDNLNRLVSKTYSGDLTGTLSSCYQYDTAVSPANDQFPKGHLTLEWTQAGSCQAQTAMPSAARTAKIILGHDAMGRSLGEQQCVASKCTSATPYVLSFGYDLAGNLSGLTNSVGAQNQPLTLTTFYDAAARPCLVTSSWTGPSPGNFAANLLQVNPNSAGYAAHGALQNYYLGSTSLTASSSCGSAPSSPINVVQGYTNRLWMYSISATGQIPQ